VAKYKNIKSVAHNIGHSFLSDVNMVGSGRAFAFVPDEIYAVAKAAGEPVVRIDLMTAEIEPPSLATRNIREAAEHYSRTLPDMLASQNVEPQMVRGAYLELRFDFAHPSSSRTNPQTELPNVVCTVSLDDDRGITHEAHPRNWCRD